MDDQPYTTPDEDPFTIRPLLAPPRRRRSSMLDKWIKEQQGTSSASSSSSGGGGIQDLTDDKPCDGGEIRNLTPYLAYPDLHSPRPNPSPCESAVTLNSYDLVDDDDIPPQLQDELSEVSTRCSTLNPNVSKKIQFFRISFIFFPPPPYFFPLPITHYKSTLPIPLSHGSIIFTHVISTLGKGTGRSTPNSKAHNQHNRSSSLSTLNTQTSSPSTTIPDFPSPASTKWRPTVLGFFSSPNTSSQVSVLHSETLYASSRPSMCSSNTGTSTSITTPSTVMEDVPPSPKSPTKPEPLSMSFVSSIRSRRRVSGNTLHVVGSSEHFESPSSPTSYHGSMRGPGSLRLPFAPKGGSLMNNTNYDPQEYEEDEDDECCQQHQQASRSGPSRPEVAFSGSNKGGTLPRVSFASLNQKKKKKLVISGIAPNEARKFDGAKRWCETFGEVSQIVRMPNGDLHVHFRSADVADTHSRLPRRALIIQPRHETLTIITSHYANTDIPDVNKIASTQRYSTTRRAPDDNPML
ncbi:hypothetical protein VNI00_001837 [Paramarasmius palmivorus]|uniref:Uncharacterized protein n=1 Tax=Paramarasmius palmivorus TaxID=297713 RepID=A0AAW0E6Y6_9AGAR